MTVTILVGDAVEQLCTRPDNSVHCCVVSPPYWRLRDYGVPPRTWGGDPNCVHQWGDELLDRSRRSPGTQGGNLTGDGRYQAEACRFEIRSNFCVGCGAWLGPLGLEPSPDLFVDHMVEVFEEVRRVLRPDGTLWLNIGDSYATGAGRVGERPGGGDQGDAWAGTPPLPREDVYHRGTKARGRPAPGATSMAGEGKRRANRDGTHAGKYTGMTSIGPMTQPNRMPLPGLKPKDLVGVPWMLAFALRRAGWRLRQEIIWAKPNPMPESTTDRCTKAHESLFLLTKSERYFYDGVAIAEPANYADSGMASRPKGYFAGSNRSETDESKVEKPFRAIQETRNKRSVWMIATQPFPQAHFATFPPALVEPCVLAGTSARGCCMECGSPWRRITGKQDTGRTQKMPDGMATHAGGHDAIHREGREKGAAGNPVMETVTVGWWPTCRCEVKRDLPPYPEKPSRANSESEDEYKRAQKRHLLACARVDNERRMLCEEQATRRTAPAVVLDPFGGAGTTGLVADRLQRDALLIELKPEYAEMARRRIDDDAGLFARAAE